MITILITLVVIGVLLGLINTYVPMAPPFKPILNGLVVLCTILWLLQAFGLLGRYGYHLR